MSDIAIIYYTDNTLETEFAGKVQDRLVEAADGKLIICVSQKPMRFGLNICLGDIGRSHHSLFTQALAGAKVAGTKYIALAEHDCMYTKEHFNFVPPKDDVFYYNIHHWFVQWRNKLEGQYSYFRRKTLSMLICNRLLFVEAIEEKLQMLDTGAQIRKGQPGACEPGVCDNRVAFMAAKAALKDVGKGKQFTAEAFRTELPNIDIRHGKNFSGGRRARQRTYSIPYWGSFHAVMGEPPPGKWYQEATIRGKKMPTRRCKDPNEGRWKRFVKPFLAQAGGGVFVELGCNAGFYCRKAASIGYKAIGVEREVEFIRHAHYWETCDPVGVQLVESDLMNYDIPRGAVVLLANVHYWLTPEELVLLVKKLSESASRVIVIGRRQTVPKHKSNPGYRALLKQFKGWAHGSVVTAGKHYSTSFINTSTGTVTTMRVDDIFPRQQLAKSKRFYASFRKMVETGDEADYAAYIKWRKFGGHTLERHRKLIADVRKNGIQQPLVMEGDRVVDGDHRLIIAEVLGIREVQCLGL